MIKRILAAAAAVAILSTSAFAQGALTPADVETVAVTATASTATFATSAQNAPTVAIFRNDGAVQVFIDFGRTAVAASATAIPLAPCEQVTVSFVGNRPLYASLITASSASSVRVVGVLGQPTPPASFTMLQRIVYPKNDGCSTLIPLPLSGIAVASATALPQPAARSYHVTGTTAITSVVATSLPIGTEVTLIFDGILNFTDGGNLKLASTMATTADDTITIVWDGTSWFEKARSVN